MERKTLAIMLICIGGGMRDSLINLDDAIRHRGDSYLKLANDEELPISCRDHALTGEFSGTRECHIHPDWLLIYSKEDDDSVSFLSLISVY